MRKIHKIFATLMLSVLLIGGLCSGATSISKASASSPLDEIQLYEVTVEMRSDGTMDITYNISWKVLDSTSEGPLEWVKIGCPNSHVDELTALSRSTISKISYMSEGGGSYIRVDFDRAYQAGEVVRFSYSIHQAYMYVLEEDSHICRYSFTPGWFDEIAVNKMIIRWNSINVLDSTAMDSHGDYLVWRGQLAPGERLNASVRYNLDAFTTDPDQQYVEGDQNGLSVLGIVIIVIIAIAIIAFLVALFSDDGSYGGGRGCGGTVFIHSGGCAHSSCACASCACACACAGGGRAGCSLKDFYHTDLQLDKLRDALKP